MSNPFGLGQASIKQHRPADAGREAGEWLEGVIDGRIESIRIPCWPSLSRSVHPFLPGNLSVLCGDPGTSKSFFVLQAMHALHLAGVGVWYYALEGSRKDHAMRLLAQISGQPGMADTDWLKANPSTAQQIIDANRDALSEFGERVDTSPNDPVDHDRLLRWTEERCIAGARVLCIDPVTAASAEREPWVADQKFVTAVRKVLDKHGASMMVVTHPKNGSKGVPGMETLAGGAAWSRFTDSVLWLTRHEDDNAVQVRNPFGGCDTVMANRTIFVCKARHARGAGYRLGYWFDPKSLTFKELGVVTKATKQESEAM
jgi:KaiC/GvpD/RAD55 family RecA-like ATPase